MKKLLVVVDMQNDFIDGSLGSKEAQAIVPNVVKKIQEWDGDIIATLDTHNNDYLKTNEGKHLPVTHCINGSKGHEINSDIEGALRNKINAVLFTKPHFGSLEISEYINGCNYNYIEFVGLCTDICVVSNALLVKAYCPEADIAVDASCCAGVTPESHKAALLTMNMCQIDIIGE